MVTIEDFSQLVCEIYSAAVESKNWDVALEGIASALGATGCALLTSGRMHSEIAVRSVGADPTSMTTYNDYYGHLDPCPPRLQRIAAGTVVTRQQLVSRDLMVRSAEFFNDWANPNDYGDGIYSVLSSDEVGTSWLCAAAKAKPDPFGTREKLALVRALVPHIQHAITIHSRLSELDRRYQDLVAALDSLADGIAIVGGDGRLIHLNPAAEAILACRDGLCVRAGILRATSSRMDRVLDRVVHQALAGRAAEVATGGCVVIPRSFGQRPYVVRVIPTSLAESAGEAAPTALIVIGDPEQNPLPDSETLRRLYGLTRSEAEVALRVLDGTGLVPIAEELSVSISTVRTHLKHVFEKTDTHRQAELVGLLLRGLTARINP